MELGQEGRNATLSNALSFCSRFGLDMDSAKNIIQNMLETFSGCWQEAFQAFAVSEHDKELFQYTFNHWGVTDVQTEEIELGQLP